MIRKSGQNRVNGWSSHKEAPSIANSPRAGNLCMRSKLSCLCETAQRCAGVLAVLTLLSSAWIGFDVRIAAVAAMVCAVAMLLLLETTRHRQRLQWESCRESLRELVSWAQQQMDLDPKAFPKLLDKKIHNSFFDYARVLEAGAGGAKQRVAELQLRILAEFLEDPSVNSAIRSANWHWAAEWERELQAAEWEDEVEMRCAFVFPTIVAAARVLPVGMARLSGGKAPVLLGHERVHHMASWCADFLEQAKVKAFLSDRLSRSKPAHSQKMPEPTQALPKRKWRSICCSNAWPEKDQEAQLGSLAQRHTRGEEEEQTSTVVLEAIEGSLQRRTAEGQKSCWADVDPTQMVVRGPAYLEDRRKVLSGTAMMELVSVDICKPSSPVVHYAASRRSGNLVWRLRQAGERRFLFVTNWLVSPFQVAVVWAIPEDSDWRLSPEGRLFRDFRYMNDDDRNARLKLIPRVVDAPSFIRSVLSETPSIIGQKLPISYFAGADYLEASINVSSSKTGRNMVKWMCGASKHFSVEIFLLIEGQRREELPERILGGFSLYQVDLDSVPVC